jgi:uncharacterized protein YhhL (DUF1145 family)/uncharacterized protein YaaR (DUF327 family)
MDSMVIILMMDMMAIMNILANSDMVYSTLFQTALTILSSIITGGFVLIFVEIGNRKNRENDHYDFLMSPFMHKLSSYFRFISWCSSRINYPRNLNGHETRFKEIVEKISRFGGRAIVSGGDYSVNYFKASELRKIAEDINNIWYLHEKMHPCNLIWRDIIYESNELIDHELAEINTKYLSMPYDINLVSKVSSDFFVYIYQPVEYETFKHESYMAHFSRLTSFVSIAVFLVLFILCMMLFVEPPMLLLQISTVIVVLLLLSSLLLLAVSINKQISWYNRLKSFVYGFFHKFKRNREPAGRFS